MYIHTHMYMYIHIYIFVNIYFYTQYTYIIKIYIGGATYTNNDILYMISQVTSQRSINHEANQPSSGLVRDSLWCHWPQERVFE